MKFFVTILFALILTTGSPVQAQMMSDEPPPLELQSGPPPDVGNSVLLENPTPSANPNDPIASDPYCREYCSIRPDDPSCARCNQAARNAATSKNEGVVNVGNPLDPKFGSNLTPGADTGDAITAAQTRIGQLLGNMLRGIAALSLLPIVVGGFQMIISQGNEDKVSRGKQTLYFGVVGLVLALLGIAIFQTLLSLLVTSK